MLISMQDLTVFGQGIVPLLEVDIGLSLQQMEVEVIGVTPNLGIQYLK